jgi:hypothetical protein
MAPNLLFYQLLVIALVLICFIIQVWWPDEPSRASKAPLESNKRRRKRSKEPKPFSGLIHKPLCEPWTQGADTPYGQEIRTSLYTSGYVSAMPHSMSCLPPRFRPYSLSMGADLTDAEREMGWKKLLSYITGSVDQELLLRHAYLVAENRILRQQIQGRVRLSDGERKTLAEIGKQLGKQALQEVATVVTPETILAWHRKLVAQKFDGSQQRKTLGRPKMAAELEALVVRIAQRIARGAMIVSLVPSPIWAIRSVLKPWATS